MVNKKWVIPDSLEKIVKKLILFSLMAISLGLTTAQSATPSDTLPSSISPPTSSSSSSAFVPAKKEEKKENKAEITPPREDRIAGKLLTFVNGISTEPTPDHEEQIEKLKKETEENLVREVTLDTLSAGKAIKNFMTEVAVLIKARNLKFLLPNPHQESLLAINPSPHASIIQLMDALSVYQITALQAACASKLEYLSIRSNLDLKLATLIPRIKPIIDNEKKRALEIEGWISRANARFSVIQPGHPMHIDSQHIHAALAAEMKDILRFGEENLVLAKVELIFNDGSSADDYLSDGTHKVLFGSGETFRDVYRDYSYYNGATKSSRDGRKILSEAAIFSGIQRLFKLTQFALSPELKGSAPTRSAATRFADFSKKYYHSEQFMSIFTQDVRLGLIKNPVDKIKRLHPGKEPVAMTLHMHSLRDICDQCSLSLRGLLQYLRDTYPNLAVTLCASSQEAHTLLRRTTATTKKDLANSFFNTPIEIYHNIAMHNMQSPFYVQLHRI